MILEEINKANIEAMKQHDEVSRTILGILKNKELVLRTSAEKRAKNESVTEADMVNILQKTIKELDEEAENYQKVNNQAEVDTIMAQKRVVEKFLPQMMSKESIKAEIDKLDDKSIGSVMKHFKINFAGKCDMKDVQEVLKSL